MIFSGVSSRGSIESMKSITFGEILWDIIEQTENIGGASYNFAAHLAKLGVESYFISSVGRDNLGSRAAEALSAHGINSDYLGTVDQAPTGTVSVELADGQPSYTIHEPVAWDLITLTEKQLERIAAEEWDIFYYGTLAQRSEINRATIAELFGRVRAGHRFCDINLRQHYYSRQVIEESLRQATIVKLNHEEADLIGGMFGLDGREGDETHARRIAGAFDVETLIITRGKEGALVLDADEFRSVPVAPVEVADAVGAGDSFSAGFMYALIHGKSAFEAAEFGGALGSWVASCRGAVPDYSDEIRARFGALGKTDRAV
jgi:fructokinase